MISFYDWAPTTSGGPQRQEDDLAAQESCETQQAICQKIQEGVRVSREPPNWKKRLPCPKRVTVCVLRTAQPGVVYTEPGLAVALLRRV